MFIFIMIIFTLSISIFIQEEKLFSKNKILSRCHIAVNVLTIPANIKHLTKSSQCFYIGILSAENKRIKSKLWTELKCNIEYLRTRWNSCSANKTDIYCNFIPSELSSDTLPNFVNVWLYCATSYIIYMRKLLILNKT